MIYIYIHKIEASLFHQCNIFPRVCISLLYLNNANSAERSRWTVIPCNFVQLHEPKAQYLSGHIEIAFCQLFFLLLSLNRIPFDKKHRDVTRKGKRKSIVGKKIEREKRKKKIKMTDPENPQGLMLRGMRDTFPFLFSRLEFLKIFERIYLLVIRKRPSGN